VNELDSSASLKVPLTQTLSLFAGGGFSTLDRLLGALVPKSQAVTLSTLPRYWDASGGVVWQPSARLKVQALLLFSSDRLIEWPGTTPFSTVSPGSVTQQRWFGRAQAKAEWQASDTLRASFTAGGGPERSTAATWDVNVAHFQARAKVEWAVRSGLMLSAGADTTMQHVQGFIIPTSGAASWAALTKNTRWSVAEWVQASWRPFAQLELVPGVRVEQNLRLGTTFDPRLVARWELVKGLPGVESLALRAAAGWFHAPPPLLDLDATIGNPALAATSAVHLAAGLEYRPVRPTFVSVQGFYVDLSNAIVTTSATTTSGTTTVAENLSNEGTGHTAGLEVFVQQQLAAGLEGWASYTLSRSELSTSSSSSPISTWDQTHVLAAQLSYRLPWAMKVSARFQYASGTPTTATTGSLFDASTNQYLTLSGTTLAARTQAFKQLDLRFEKAWQLQTVQLTAYLDVRNVTNEHNVVSSPQYNFDSTQQVPLTGLPILPMVGLRGEY
jgi:hypothetical protein